MITKIRKKQIVMILILLTLFSLLFPHFVRLIKHDYTITGPESYYHANIADQIASEGFISEDTFVVGSRPYIFNPYDYTLAFFSSFLGTDTASRILPVLLGMISTLLIYLILRKLKINLLETLCITGIWLLSPVFIKTFFVSNGQSSRAFHGAGKVVVNGLR